MKGRWQGQGQLSSNGLLIFCRREAFFVEVLQWKDRDLQGGSSPEQGERSLEQGERNLEQEERNL